MSSIASAPHTASPHPIPLSGLARFDAPGRCPVSGIRPAHDALRERILAADYPCVAARSVFNRDSADLVEYGRLGDPVEARRLAADLARFGRERAAAIEAETPGFVSYIAAFDARTAIADEADFERQLWEHLSLVHRFDALTHAWDPAVSSDPDSAEFSFSVGGRAYYVIGMHPGASRLSRRMPVPMLVFNPHAQFERLKANGKYDGLRQSIRRRETDLQGSVNPTLADHGSASEARQYSGRAIGADWICPFQASGAVS